MGILSTVLLVFFVIIAILLILLVLVQNEEGDSLGGIFAGGSGSAFGSRSGNVLTRATTVLGALFLVISLGLALLNRTPGGSGVEEAGRQLSSEAASGNWLEDELNPQPQLMPDDALYDELNSRSRFTIDDTPSNDALENETSQQDDVVTE
jgi:preprotein translocase subunit SecG